MKANYTFQKLSQVSKKFPNLVAIREPKKDYTYKTFINMVSNISNLILSQKKNSGRPLERVKNRELWLQVLKAREQSIRL